MMIIADDMTGALDTAAQFSQNGVTSVVLRGTEFRHLTDFPQAEVLAVNTDSRHDDPILAKFKVTEVVSYACFMKIPYIYKKTDSVLRGNIGAELEAVMMATGAKKMAFIPAYPKVGRITCNGCQYVDGIPVHKSQFGKDVFAPVIESHIKELIHQQNSIPVTSRMKEYVREEFSGIGVFDADRENELYHIADVLKAHGLLFLTGGCAGFAAALNENIGFERAHKHTEVTSHNILIISGSVNEKTIGQIKHAEKTGVPSVTMPGRMRYDRHYFEGEHQEDIIEQISCLMKKKHAVIVKTLQESTEMEESWQQAHDKGISMLALRRNIRANIGRLVRTTLEAVNIDTLVVFGGDTLTGIMEELECAGIMPLEEITEGIILNRMETGTYSLNVVSKSGGFGDEKVIEGILDYLSGGEYREKLKNCETA